MELIEKRADLTVAHKIGYILFSITFLVLPFYYQDNLGGEGMSLPFNAVIWIGVAAMVGLGVVQVIISGEWVKTPYLGLLSLFPLGILLSGFISGMERPGEWINVPRFAPFHIGPKIAFECTNRIVRVSAFKTRHQPKYG